MTDREKVINGLECCSAYDYRCNDCPYQDDGGAEDDCYSDELYADALALLKAQGPRVMTLEEWKNLPEPKDGECLCYEINSCDRLQAMLDKAFAGSENLYGKVFRCWTSRPDQATREATPWDL